MALHGEGIEVRHDTARCGQVEFGGVRDSRLDVARTGEVSNGLTRYGLVWTSRRKIWAHGN